MGSRWGPPDGWDALPECASDCFYHGLKDTQCERGNMACLCDDENWEIVGEALDSCGGCSGDDLWQLAANFKARCDAAKDSASSTAEPTPSPTLFTVHNEPASSSTIDTDTTSLTFIPIASYTPDLDSNNLRSRDDNTTPTPTIIGMAVGFAVAGLLLVGLILLWLRERRRRRSLEWSTEPKRESKLGSRLSLTSKRASKRSNKGETSVQVVEKGIWRPTGPTQTPSP